MQDSLNCVSTLEFLGRVPENPPIKLLYFILKYYKSPIILLISSYFSFNFVLKMAAKYAQ